METVLTMLSLAGPAGVEQEHTERPQPSAGDLPEERGAASRTARLRGGEGRQRSGQSLIGKERVFIFPGV